MVRSSAFVKTRNVSAINLLVHFEEQEQTCNDETSELLRPSEVRRKSQEVPLWGRLAL
jgi:hypothetical protein